QRRAARLPAGHDLRWRGPGLWRALRARRQPDLHHAGAGAAGMAAGARRGTMSFRAFVLRETDGRVAGGIETLEEADLPKLEPAGGEVTVAVDCSTLNYKDGMILKGLGRLVRRYPHVPGVDFAGR